MVYTAGINTPQEDNDMLLLDVESAMKKFIGKMAFHVVPGMEMLKALQLRVEVVGMDILKTKSLAYEIDIVCDCGNMLTIISLQETNTCPYCGAVYSVIPVRVDGA